MNNAFSPTCNQTRTKIKQEPKQINCPFYFSQLFGCLETVEAGILKSVLAGALHMSAFTHSPDCHLLCIDCPTMFIRLASFFNILFLMLPPIFAKVNFTISSRHRHEIIPSEGLHKKFAIFVKVGDLMHRLEPRDVCDTWGPHSRDGIADKRNNDTETETHLGLPGHRVSKALSQGLLVVSFQIVSQGLLVSQTAPPPA